MNVDVPQGWLSAVAEKIQTPVLLTSTKNRAV
jgi:hypothetical protein